ncbi:hypothetical protein [Burkholderia glumae]|uniref:hypothetical protein n=1 Tax=Burkholderia glumae TaxID=337 RepID=UPI0009B7A0C4|nr:hypothetical protein [Burkholderia glumae]MCM2491540.1 hypothetical protein [Burkholderia glumae]
MKTLIAALCVALPLAGCSDSHLKVKLTHNPAFPNIPRLRIVADSPTSGKRYGEPHRLRGLAHQLLE